MRHKPLILALLAGLALPGAAQAMLIDRGGGLIYDNVLDITWLADANYAQTSGYDADGRMTWADAMAWADTLTYHDSVRNVDYSDWRLPNALNYDGSGLCGGFGCTSSEMGHLYYVDGGLSVGGGPIDASTTLDDYFTNMQSDEYWYDGYGPEFALFFDNAIGFQYDVDLNMGGLDYYAWAVRPGDVAAAVPEPATLMLLSLGLAGLGVMRRRG